MDACVVCGNGEFYVESGYYFCQECQTQREDKREEVVEYIHDSSTHVRRKKIKRIRAKTVNADERLGWTTWEVYNFILVGWVNELIMLGASPEIKTTALQLWASYLGKLEVAFTSVKHKGLPRLPRDYRKKDVEILYGKKAPDYRKKRKRKGSSTTSASANASAATSSDSDSSYTSDIGSNRQVSRRKSALVQMAYEMTTSESGTTDVASSVSQSLHSVQSTSLQSKKRGAIHLNFNKFARAEAKRVNELSKTVPWGKKVKFQKTFTRDVHKESAENLTLQEVLCVVILALRLHDEKIHISDLLRFQHEGHMSSKRLDHLFPDDEPLPDDLKTVYRGYTYDKLHVGSSRLAKLLEVWQLPEPNLVEMIRRYCTELQLPDGIALYVERMIALSPPKLTFKPRNTRLPLYEAKAVSFILIVMKILFGLDGVTEYEISRVVDKINTIAKEKDALDAKLFSFTEWQRYIECRRSVIVDRHYPTKFRYDPESPCSSRNLISYVDYMSKLAPAGFVDTIASCQQITDVINQNVERLAENLPEVEEPRRFEPSLTPMHSYLQELLKDPTVDLPSILREDFSATKVGYMTSPKVYKELARQCGIDLKVIDSSINFVERIVPIFRGDKLSTDIEEQSRPTRVVKREKGDKKSDDSMEYLHYKNTGKIFIDQRKRKLYEENRKLIDQDRKQENHFDDFAFDEVRDDGRLITGEMDDDSDSDDDGEVKTAGVSYKNILLTNYERMSLRGAVKSHWHAKDEIRTSFYQWDMKRFLASEEEKKSWEGCECLFCYIYKSPFADMNTEPVDTAVNDEDEAVDDNKDNANDVTVIEDKSDLSIIGEKRAESTNDNDEVSILQEKKAEPEREYAFRPYRDYWMQRCYGHHDYTNFDWHLMERDLPVNFRWLLHECAKMIEMDPLILCHEFTNVEAFYSDTIVKDYDVERGKKFYDALCRRHMDIANAVRSRWRNTTRKDYAEEQKKALREEQLAKSKKKKRAKTVTE